MNISEYVQMMELGMKNNMFFLKEQAKMIDYGESIKAVGLGEPYIEIIEVEWVTWASLKWVMKPVGLGEPYNDFT